MSFSFLQLHAKLLAQTPVNRNFGKQERNSLPSIPFFRNRHRHYQSHTAGPSLARSDQSTKENSNNIIAIDKTASRERIFAAAQTTQHIHTPSSFSEWRVNNIQCGWRSDVDTGIWTDLFLSQFTFFCLLTALPSLESLVPGHRPSKFKHSTKSEYRRYWFDF